MATLAAWSTGGDVESAVGVLRYGAGEVGKNRQVSGVHGDELW